MCTILSWFNMKQIASHRICHLNSKQNSNFVKYHIFAHVYADMLKWIYHCHCLFITYTQTSVWKYIKRKRETILSWCISFSEGLYQGKCIDLFCCMCLCRGAGMSLVWQGFWAWEHSWMFVGWLKGGLGHVEDTKWYNSK